MRAAGVPEDSITARPGVGRHTPQRPGCVHGVAGGPKAFIANGGGGVVVADEFGEFAKEIGFRYSSEVQLHVGADQSVRMLSRPKTAWPYD